MDYVRIAIIAAVSIAQIAIGAFIGMYAALVAFTWSTL